MFPTADAEELSQVTSVVEKSGSSDASNSPENTQLTTPNNREITLNMLFKEMVFCVALALTTYGALHNTPPIVSKHPQAVRFFSPDSIVADWYKGELTEAMVDVSNSDIALVMYYAPWDAESQYVRGEFEKAATVLGDRVHFAAINCWNPGSECRLQYNKIISAWPIIMAYPVTIPGVHYKGPRDAHSIVNFLELMMKPIKRVASADDLISLLSYCDAVAVGYTPLSETSKHYNVWYQVSLKVREYDTIGEICFAAVTSEELAVDLGVEIVPNARLMLWNETKDYMSEEGSKGSWNGTSLLIWVLKNFSQPVARIIPMWKKAFSFERYVDGNPILIMFTPLNPIYEQLPNYALMREIAMEYYNCKNNETSAWTSELIKLQQVQRLLYQQKDYLKYCQQFKFKKPVLKANHYKKEVEAQNNLYPWLNSTQKVQKTGIWSNFFTKGGLGIGRDSESLEEHSNFWSWDWLHECSTKALPAERSFYDNYEQCRLFEQNFNLEPEQFELNADIETTMQPFEDDPLSPENLIQDNVKHFCKLIKFAQEFSPQISPSKDIEEERYNATSISGLSCANNFSLYMIAIDSVRNHHFAESLGIDVFSKKDMTAVVILDTKHERQYHLSEELSAKSIREFIHRFTSREARGSLRTHVATSHTHYFDANRNEEHSTDVERIVDLTTRSFRRMLNTSGTLSIVCVCNGACGAAAARAAAHGARLLRACGVRAAAARLDARRHDLPAHYAAHHYPTVFVFPPDRSREAESRAYPREARISSGGVVALALRALGPPQHLRVRLALCNHARVNIEKKTCLKDIREHITTVIGRNLKYWRRTDNRELKDALFKRLQHLHRVALDLSLLQTSDLTENNIKQSSLLASLTGLADNWKVDDSLLKDNRAMMPGKQS